MTHCPVIGTGSFAAAVWIYREQTNVTNARVLSKGASSDTDTGYCIWGGDTSIYVSVSDGTTRESLGGTHNGVGKWTHIVLNVPRAENKIQLYIDGTLVSEKSIASGDINSARNLHIGRNASASNLYWPGRIDDVRIYNRSLSESEIKLIAKKLL